MKMKKVFASLAAVAFAASAMAVNTFALPSTDYLKDGTVFINADKPEDPTWAIDAGVAQTDVYGVTFHVTFGSEEWFGGGIGANSNSTGWESHEWGSNSKEITADVDNGTITWLKDSPVFAADDAYAQLWMQTWSGTVTINSADILGAGGVILSDDSAPAEAESDTDTAAAADSGVAIDTVMVIQENATWATTKSANVTITGAGDYTYTLDGLSIDPATLTVLYIKDASCVDSDPAAGYTATIPDGSAVVKSFKINGNDVALSGDSSLYDDAGKIIDMCFFNTWAAKETFFDAPADTIESVEVTISVSASDAAAPAPVAETAETVEVVEDEDEGIELVEEDAEPAPVVEDVEPVEVVETAPEVVEAAPEVVETAPAVQETAPVKTGNTAAAAIAVVMVAAGAAAVISKRK